MQRDPHLHDLSSAGHKSRLIGNKYVSSEDLGRILQREENSSRWVSLGGKMGTSQAHMECQKKKSGKCVLSLCDKIL